MNTVLVLKVIIIIFLTIICTSISYWTGYLYGRNKEKEEYANKPSIHLDVPIINVSSISKIKRIKFERMIKKDFVINKLGECNVKDYLISKIMPSLLEPISHYLVYKQEYDIDIDKYCFYGYLEVVDNNADSD